MNIYILLGFILGFSYTESPYKENKEIVHVFKVKMNVKVKIIVTYQNKLPSESISLSLSLSNPL